MRYLDGRWHNPRQPQSNKRAIRRYRHQDEHTKPEDAHMDLDTAVACWVPVFCSPSDLGNRESLDKLDIWRFAAGNVKNTGVSGFFSDRGGQIEIAAKRAFGICVDGANGKAERSSPVAAPGQTASGIRRCAAQCNVNGSATPERDRSAATAGDKPDCERESE